MDYGERGPLPHGLFQKLGTVLPLRDGAGGSGGGTADTCGADGKQFCPSPWPVAELGPIPRAPPYSTEIVQPSAIVGGQVVKDRNLTVCGIKCNGPKDCSLSMDTYGCDCAFPNAEDAHWLGLDPVSPPSVCLSL